MKKLNSILEGIGILILYLMAVAVIIGTPLTILGALLWFLYKLLTGFGYFLLEALRIIFN